MLVRVILNFEYFTKRTIQVYLLWIIFILIYLFFSRELTVSRPFIVTTLGGFGLGLLVNRFLYLGIFKYFQNSNYLIKKVIILGYNDTAKRLAKYFEEDGINTQMMGFIEDNRNIHELSHYPVFGDVVKYLANSKRSGSPGNIFNNNTRTKQGHI